MDIIRLETVDSTQKWMLENTSGGSEDAVVISKAQTNGYGRFKRRWNSLPGNFFSSFRILDRENNKKHNSSIIALSSVNVLHAAISEVLSDVDVPIKIKWPNDIIVNNKKISGILVNLQHKYGNTSVASNMYTYYIVGVGINCASTPKDIIGTSCTSLSEHKPGVTLEDVENALVYRMSTLSDDIKNPSATVQYWTQHCAHINQYLSCRSGGRIISGKFIGLDTDGNAILENARNAKKYIVPYGDIQPD